VPRLREAGLDKSQQRSWTSEEEYHREPTGRFIRGASAGRRTFKMRDPAAYGQKLPSAGTAAAVENLIVDCPFGIERGAMRCVGSESDMPKRLIVGAGIAAIVLGFAIIGMGIAQLMGQHEHELRQQAQQEHNKQIQLQLDQLKSQIDQLKTQTRSAPAPK
jgi:hypothetical protein